MKKYFHLILITLLFGNTPKDSYVLLISFDGFRADYLDWYDTPNFDRLAEQGVKADGMKPVFVSKTFPNHYSIATGMYIENHGLIGNYFYDEKLDEYFTLSDRSKVEDARFYGGEPIWVTAEKQGVKSASYFWAGSAAAVGGVRPGIWKEYDHDFPFPARIDSVAKWFSLPEEKRPHLIMLYFHEPDATGHRYGPESPETEAMVDSMDVIMGKIMSAMELLDIYPKLNIIVVSDHGMVAISPERTINLSDYVNLSGIEQEGSGPFSMLYGKKKRKLNRIVKKLKSAPHMSVYKKKEIPDRYHFKNHYRIKDVLMVADEGWYILDKKYFGADKWSLKFLKGGTHGYDNELRSMHAIFLADGPAFKDGYKRPTFENIHVYPLITEILGLTSYEMIDGRLEEVQDLLKD
ncbi:MAG: alkaline phosphatase family protein [Candidatus Marinimicrobia bacterium]|nr:alkaline phosphatase family protein [Candidatus Neomarinimicrobiota bacterium]MCH7762313.1 alkaline phosphatase family protein [Candidatus Neomarinimicrobiota bacterium]